jgi:hypothetical protein
MWIDFVCVCVRCGVRVLTYRWTNYRTIPPTRDDRDLCGECKMSLLNESWPVKMQCPKCFMRYYGPGDHKCPQGPLLNEDGVSLTSAAHPRPWYWWATWLWYRLFPPRLNEASVESVESILIAIRKQIDRDKGTILIRDKRDE